MVILYTLRTEQVRQSTRIPRGDGHDTYSKTFEYSSFLTERSWTATSNAPRGKAINESIKLPENAKEQIAEEQNPPIGTICHHA